MRYAFFALLLFAAGCATRNEPLPPGTAGATTDLFNGADLTGWTAFLADSTARMEDVWSVRPDSGILVCKGEPWGYLRTEQAYDDYVLHVEWRWAPGTEPGNSGVFVKVEGPDRQWPRCIEAQLKSGREGDFVLMEGMALDTAPERIHPEVSIIRLRSEDAANPVGAWNTYDITVRGDSVVVELNGHRVNEGAGAPAGPGGIALQSEGGEIHFRNVRITPLG